MRNFILVVLAVILSGTCLQAQQDPHFSQYMFNKSYWSPALTALDDKGSVSLLSRAQWLGYEPSVDQDGGAPSTQFINFSTPVTIKKIPIGVGVNVIYDQAGPINTIDIQTSIAYHKKLNRGTLSLGIRPGLTNRTLLGSRLRYVDQDDPLNTGVNESQAVFDLALGIGYSTDSYILAAGVNHLLRPRMNYGLDGSINKRMNLVYNLYGEYNYRLTYNIDLTPSLLATSDINTFSLDISLVATYNKKLWGGLSYRNNEAMTLLLGYSFFDNQQLNAGYAFDYIIKEQSAKQPTSHEIFIRYNLPSISTGAKKIIRTPRFRY